MDEERISQRILYVMVGLVVAVFLCFYLIGFDEPFAADSSFNAPMLTDLLISFMWFLFGIAVVAAGIAAVRSVRLARNNERLSMVFQHERLLQSYMVQPSFALF